MKTLNVILLGFGNVHRALAELLMRKADTLRSDFDLEVRVVGIATGRHGQIVNQDGINLNKALELVRAGESLASLHLGPAVENGDTAGLLGAAEADLVFEATPTNPDDGQPALAYIFGALEKGMHVVTANKGPVAHGYRELSELAARNDVGFFFESTVMDGAPVFSVWREGLPASNIKRVRGIFNSTTNYILSRMEEESLPFDAALAAAQEIGVAETDPTLDVDGWDSAIKTVILANVLMGGDFRPKDANPTGIRGIELSVLQAAIDNGQRTRLVCEAAVGDDGQISLSVGPQQVDENSSIARVTGTSNIIDYEADTLHKLTLVENNPGPDTTAYGMFTDMLNIVRGRYQSG